MFTCLWAEGTRMCGSLLAWISIHLLWRCVFTWCEAAVFHQGSSRIHLSVLGNTMSRGKHIYINDHLHNNTHPLIHALHNSVTKYATDCSLLWQRLQKLEGVHAVFPKQELQLGTWHTSHLMCLQPESLTLFVATVIWWCSCLLILSHWPTGKQVCSPGTFIFKWIAGYTVPNNNSPSHCGMI